MIMQSDMPILCNFCGITDVTDDDPEQECTCAKCWDIIHANDYLAWCKIAEKKKWQIDKKRHKTAIRLVADNPVLIEKLQAERAK